MIWLGGYLACGWGMTGAVFEGVGLLCLGGLGRIGGVKGISCKKVKFIEY